MPSLARVGATSAPAPLYSVATSGVKVLQPFVHAPDAPWIRISIEEPVLASLGPCSPKQADRRRYIKMLRKTVSDHRHMRQSAHQFGPTHAALPIFQLIVVEGRPRLLNP